MGRIALIDSKEFVNKEKWKFYGLGKETFEFSKSGIVDFFNLESLGMKILVGLLLELKDMFIPHT